MAKQIQSYTNKDSVVGTTWPTAGPDLLKPPGRSRRQAEGGHDGLVGHVDDRVEGANPNCMYLWMNHMISPEAQATVAETFGEAPVNLKACEVTKNQNHCDEFHADDESWWEDVYYWTTPAEDCADDEIDTCKTQEDWRPPGRRSGASAPELGRAPGRRPGAVPGRRLSTFLYRHPRAGSPRCSRCRSAGW